MSAASISGADVFVWAVARTESKRSVTARFFQRAGPHHILGVLFIAVVITTLRAPEFRQKGFEAFSVTCQHCRQTRNWIPLRFACRSQKISGMCVNYAWAAGSPAPTPGS